MRFGSTVGLVALNLSLVFLMAASAGTGGDARPRRFATATEVFDAYRDARTQGDLRKSFSFLTVAAQDDAVFEAFFSSRSTIPRRIEPS